MRVLMQHRAWPAAALLAATVGAVTPCLAGTPLNDTCATASGISGAGQYDFDTTGSGLDEPTTTCEGFQHSDFSSSAVWFSYTAQTTGTATVRVLDTYNVVYSTVFGGFSLAAFESCDQFFELGCSADGHAGAPMHFDIDSGSTYLIRVANYYGYIRDPDTGEIVDGVGEYGPASLSIVETPTPANDTCAGATVMQTAQFYPWSTLGADTDMFVSCDDGEGSTNDVFFRFTAPSNGTYEFSTADVDIGEDGWWPVLTLFTGTCGSMTEAACYTSFGYYDQIRFTRVMTANQTVTMRLARPSHYVGSFSGKLSVLNVGVPANDTCAAATTVGLGTTGFQNTGTVADSSAASCFNSTNDVFFAFTPAQSGRYRIDTCGSYFDSVLTLSASCGGAELVCNNDYYECAVDHSFFASRVDAELRGGRTVYIRVAGTSGAERGIGSLNIALLQGMTNPGNDSCANATNVAVGSTTAVQSIALGALDGLSTCGNYESPGLWYRFTPGFTGHVKIDTCGSGDVKTVLSLYSTCGSAATGCNVMDCPSGRSQIIAPVTSGTTYRVRVGLAAGNGQAGDAQVNDATLSIAQATPPPANDVCANAMTISEGTVAFDTTDAATELPIVNYATPREDVWYAYTASAAGVIELTASPASGGGAIVRPVVRVFDACGGTVLGTGADNAYSFPGGYGSLLRLCVAGGQSVRIQVGQHGLNEHNPGQAGRGNLTLGFSPSAAFVAAPVGAQTEGETCASRVAVGNNHEDLVNGGQNLFGFTALGPISCGTAVKGTLPRTGVIHDKDYFDIGDAATPEFLVIGAAQSNARIGITSMGNIDVPPITVATTSGCSRTFSARFNINSFGYGQGELYILVVEPDDNTDTGACGLNGSEYWVRYYRTNIAAVTVGTQPADTSKSSGQTATFTVTGNGSNLSYQWRRGEALLSNGGRISGANTATLSIANVSAADAGLYSVIISSGCIAAVSNEARLTVAASCPADFNGDNNRDVADLFAYINAWLAKTANADFNTSGGVDVADLFAYINAWLAGC